VLLPVVFEQQRMMREVLDLAFDPEVEEEG